MPRRTGQTAELAVKNEALNRWRILLRHKRFQKKLNRLRKRYQQWISGPPVAHYTYMFDTHGQDEAGTENPHQLEGEISRKDVDLYIHECDPNDHMVGIQGAWRSFNSEWKIRLPKVALSNSLPDLSQDSIQHWNAYQFEDSSIVPPPVKIRHSQKTQLRLEIDLRYPRDILIERIERELVKVMQPRHKTRRRWDKFAYYLQVHDLVLNGETFAFVAKTLKKRVSTIKSAFLSIMTMVATFSPNGLKMSASRQNRAPTTTKELVFGAHNYDTHIAKCDQCSNATTQAAMCPHVQRYINQDYRGQRELQLSDIEIIWSAKSRRPGRKSIPDNDHDD